MPKYFLDIVRDGASTTRDITGLDLPDLETARIEAVETWKRLHNEQRSVGCILAQISIEISDAIGNVLTNISGPVNPLQAIPD